MKKWRSFFEAREYVRSLNLKSETEWRKFRKEKLPTDIPTNPNRTYSREWKGMGDWLGTFRIADQEKVYLPYNDAKQWACKSGIKNIAEWRIAAKNNLIPDNIPRVPYNTYKKEWITWGEFLGTGFVHYRNRKWKTYIEVQKWAIDNRIFSKEDWESIAKNKKLPQDIPFNLARVYSEWKGWPSFLGREVKGGSSIIEHIIRKEINRFIEVDENRRIVLNKRVDIIIPSKKAIIEYDGFHWHKNTIDKDKKTNSLFQANGWNVIRIREFPLKKLSENDLIIKSYKSTLEKTYKILSHLLSLNIIPQNQKESLEKYILNNELSISSNKISEILGWRSYEKAKEWVQNMNIKSETEWRRFKKENNLPIDIPCNPNIVYIEWSSWSDFLGTENVYVNPNSWRNYSAAREWSRKSGIKNAREWGRKYDNKEVPRDIPRTPDRVYKKDWVSWMDWLGVDCKEGHRKAWLSFKETKEWVKKEQIKNERTWRNYARENKIPLNIPKKPELVYSNDWKGWKDFFGK